MQKGFVARKGILAKGDFIQGSAFLDGSFKILIRARRRYVNFMSKLTLIQVHRERPSFLQCFARAEIFTKESLLLILDPTKILTKQAALSLKEYLTTEFNDGCGVLGGPGPGVNLHVLKK